MSTKKTGLPDWVKATIVVLSIGLCSFIAYHVGFDKGQDNIIENARLQIRYEKITPIAPPDSLFDLFDSTMKLP